MYCISYSFSGFFTVAIYSTCGQLLKEAYIYLGKLCISKNIISCSQFQTVIFWQFMYEKYMNMDKPYTFLHQ